MLGLLQVDTSNILDKVSSNQSSSWLYHALPASPPSLLFQLYVCVCVCVYIYIYLSKKNSQTHTVQTRAAQGSAILHGKRKDELFEITRSF